MTDIDVLYVTPEDFIRTNLEFLSTSEYDVVETSLKTRKQIKRVSRTDIRRALDSFPLDDPLQSQCAHWMHAFAGKHFFPDANHRTALATLRATLRQNGVEVGRWPQELTEETVERSKQARRNLDIDMSNLFKEDDMYAVWLDYFEEVL